LVQYDAATIATLDSSTTERLLGLYFAPYVLSKVGRILFLVLYVALLIVMLFGASKVRVHFEIEFFISEDSNIYNYLEASKKYFESGSDTTSIYIESLELDWSDPVNQDKVSVLLKNIEECTGCE